MEEFFKKMQEIIIVAITKFKSSVEIRVVRNEVLTQFLLKDFSCWSY